MTKKLILTLLLSQTEEEKETKNKNESNSTEKRELNVMNLVEVMVIVTDQGITIGMTVEEIEKIVILEET